MTKEEAYSIQHTVQANGMTLDSLIEFANKLKDIVNEHQKEDN